MTENKMYYFAYGSNMNFEQMKKRCPSSTFIERAFLKGYKFVYDGYSVKWRSTVANIIKTGDKDEVCGGVFEISKDNLAALDCYEGYPDTYNKEKIEVKGDSGSIYVALVYLRGGVKVSVPHQEYRGIVIQGAKDCGLSEEYIKNVL